MGAAAILTISKDGETIRSCPIEGEALLGRADGCVIRLEDRAISRQHALFKPVSGGIQVEKKSIFAPLNVNGNECTTAVLKEGDVISIGPYLMRLTMGTQSSASAQPMPDYPPPSLEPIDESAAMLQPLEIPGAAPDLKELGGADSSGGIPALNIQLDGAGVSTSPSDGNGMAPEGTPGFENSDSGGNALALQTQSIEFIDDDAKTKLTPVAKLSVKLILPPGTANVTEYEIKKEEVSIGRGKNCDIILDDKKSSRKNSLIRRAGVNFSIKDLDSANGTYVNGVRVSEQELTGNDLIRIGNVEFQFIAVAADYAAREQNFMPVPVETPEPMDEAPPMQGFDPQAGYVGPVPGADGGLSGIAGIGGGVSAGKGSLLEKYKALPKRTRVILLFAVFVAAYLYLDDQGATVKKPAPKTAVTAPTGATNAPSFDLLTKDQQKFVETQHELAFEYLKAQEYDKAIYEVEKIFTLIPDYKDSREIETYAREGKRRKDQIEEEKRKKEEEARNKAKVAELIEEAHTFMDKQKYDAAREIFPQILALDPDNAQVAEWRKTLEAVDEDIRKRHLEELVQGETNKRAWEFYRAGLDLRKHGKFHTAILNFEKVFDLGANDKKVLKNAKAMIARTKAQIAALREPLLAQAKEAETAGDFVKAYQLYLKAIQVDPPHPAAYVGIDRIKGILHERAKVVYTEAVLAESYSDFAVAKKKFKECLETAPKDDIYHDRAQRKLARYFRREDQEPAPQ